MHPVVSEFWVVRHVWQAVMSKTHIALFAVQLSSAWMSRHQVAHQVALMSYCTKSHPWFLPLMIPVRRKVSPTHIMFQLARLTVVTIFSDASWRQW